ncbi:unnamed protein product, partial [Darwinula stevensoni]
MQDLEEYCDHALALLDSYSWMHDFRVTDLLVKKVLSSDDFLELINNTTQSDTFLARCQDGSRFLLAAEIKLLPNGCHEKTYPWKYMSPKKIHEVENLLALVKDISQERPLQCIVDIGSGLGYIDHALSATSAVSVLGLECDAVKKSIKFRFCHAPALAFHRVMALSLHSCGDLSSTILKAFVEVEEIDTLLLVPCCYHHMTVHGFPLSSLLRKRRAQLSLYSLRLGAQESPRQWAARDRRLQSARVVFRAVAQLYLQQNGYELKKKRRHGVRDDAMGDFTAYIDAFLAHHELIGADKRTVDEHKTLLLALYHQQEPQLKLVEPFTRLQCHLQPVIESLILVDRFAFLQEQGFTPRILKTTTVVRQASGLTTLECLRSQELLESLPSYSGFVIDDEPDLQLAEVFPRLFVGLQSGGGVFVHCNAGISRAPSVVIAYIMKKRGWSYRQAYDHVFKIRPGIWPNDGFVKQLKEYEKTLKAARSEDVCERKDLLKKQGVTHILCVAASIPWKDKDGYTFVRKEVPMADLPETDLLANLDECFKFIEEGLGRGGGVYVHCMAGISRAPSVVIGFLMKKNQWSYDQAYHHVSNIRVIMPNDGFIRQLVRYEKILTKVTK